MTNEDRKLFPLATLHSGEATKEAILEGLRAVHENAEMAKELTKPTDPELLKDVPGADYLEEVREHARKAYDHATAVCMAIERTGDWTPEGKDE